jgi:predicted nucleic acid-binding protein
MTTTFVDTNVFVRFLTNDDPEKQQRSAALFTRVEQGELQLTTPASTIAEVVYVLHSRRLYNRSRSEVVQMLMPLVKLSGLRLHRRDILMKALTIFNSTRLSFGDAMIVAAMFDQPDHVLYSFDHGFDALPEVKRVEP